MKWWLPALAAPFMLFWAAVSAAQQPTSVPFNVGATPVQVVPQGSATRQWIRIWNISAAGGPVAWCTRYRTSPSDIAAHGNPVPAANAAGSYPILPGQFEEFRINNQFVPTDSVWCVGAGGTVALTVDVH